MFFLLATRFKISTYSGFSFYWFDMYLESFELHYCPLKVLFYNGRNLVSNKALILKLRLLLRFKPYIIFTLLQNNTKPYFKHCHSDKTTLYQPEEMSYLFF